MTVHRRTFLCGIASLTLAATRLTRPAAAQTATRVKFTLPWLPLGGYAHVFVAKKLGFWETRGLDVVIDRGFGSNEVCKSLGLGQYEFGEIDLPVMMNCRSKGMDLMAIGCLSPRSPVGIFSLTKKNIRKPKDLEGRKIGFTAGSGDYQLWPAFVKATGIADAKVQKVFIEPAAHIKLLIEEQVDAVGNFYASLAPAIWAQGVDVNIMLYEHHGLPMYSLVFATRGKVVKEQPDLCARFMEGMLEGLAYTYLNPEKSTDIHLDMVKEFKGSPTNRDVIKHGVGVMTAMGLVPEAEKHGLGYMDLDMVNRTRQTVIDYMGATDVPPADQMFTNAFVGKVTLTPAQWAATREGAKRYVPH
jgi:NitT/TauT family transport system substrate-binding protein